MYHDLSVDGSQYMVKLSISNGQNEAIKKNKLSIKSQYKLKLSTSNCQNKAIKKHLTFHCQQ